MTTTVTRQQKARPNARDGTVVTPTGITPGSPGTFDPAGSTIPRNLTHLIALGALGEVGAWTANRQWVSLADGSWAYWDASAFVEARPATTATAGTPGTWSGPGAHDIAPATPAALIAADPVVVTASPLTAWTTAQRVLCRDNNPAYWDGTAWVAGQAP